MGRLSAYAKHRILKLRFKKNKRIIHIVDILKKEDNIRVSRQAVSTFLKKYLETNSIYDKPRTGRKRKLTQEEVQLIGQVTRLNRDITARAIKEYLNLNVSTYTILRATKMFEWNKVNPNSNDSKKAAALERQLNGEVKRRSRSSPSKSMSGRKSKSDRASSLDGTANTAESGTEAGTLNTTNDAANSSVTSATDRSALDEKENGTQNHDNNDQQHNDGDADDEEVGEAKETIQPKKSRKLANDSTQETNADGETKKKPKATISSPTTITKVDLNLLDPRELQSMKILSCSPMSFATKCLFKLFKTEELHGHNVLGKTLNNNIKAKLPLDPKRVGYIKFLVESYYTEKECKEMLANAVCHKQNLWKACHTAINKSILLSERKAASASANDAAKSKTDAKPERVKSELTASKKPVKKQTLQKRKRKQDTSSSSSDDDCFGTLHSEDISSEDEARIDSDADDETSQKNDNEPKTNGTSSSAAKKETDKTKISFRRNERQKVPNFNYSKPSKLDFSSDSDDSDEKLMDEDEIELIQNIESRLIGESISKSSSKSTTSAAKKNSTPAKSTPANSKSKKVKHEDTKANSSKTQEQCESSAAANVAAAMKKSIVVVGDESLVLNDQDENNKDVDDTKESVSKQTSKTSARKQNQPRRVVATSTPQPSKSPTSSRKSERTSKTPPEKPAFTPTRLTRSSSNRIAICEPAPSTTKRASSIKQSSQAILSGGPKIGSISGLKLNINGTETKNQ